VKSVVQYDFFGYKYFCSCVDDVSTNRALNVLAEKDSARVGHAHMLLKWVQGVQFSRRQGPLFLLFYLLAIWNISVSQMASMYLEIGILCLCCVLFVTWTMCNSFVRWIFRGLSQGQPRTRVRVRTITTHDAQHRRRICTIVCILLLCLASPSWCMDVTDEREQDTRPADNASHWFLTTAAGLLSVSSQQIANIRAVAQQEAASAWQTAMDATDDMWEVLKRTSVRERPVLQLAMDAWRNGPPLDAQGELQQRAHLQRSLPALRRNYVRYIQKNSHLLDVESQPGEVIVSMELLLAMEMRINRYDIWKPLFTGNVRNIVFVGTYPSTPFGNLVVQNGKNVWCTTLNEDGEPIRRWGTVTSFVDDGVKTEYTVQHEGGEIGTYRLGEVTGVQRDSNGTDTALAAGLWDKNRTVRAMRSCSNLPADAEFTILDILPGNSVHLCLGPPPLPLSISRLVFLYSHHQHPYLAEHLYLSVVQVRYTDADPGSSIWTTVSCKPQR